MRARLPLLVALLCGVFLNAPALLAWEIEPSVFEETSDKDDPVIGKWRFAVKLPDRDGSFNLTLKPGGRTDRSGGDWRNDGNRIYTVSLGGGQTAKLKLDPTGQVLAGVTPRGFKVLGFKQATGK